MRRGLVALIALLVTAGLALGWPTTASAKRNDVWQPSTWTGPAAGAPVPATGLPPAAAPAYPVGGYPPIYDVSPTYEGQAQCDPTPKPGVQATANLIKATYGANQTVWIPRACDVGGTSEHKEGRALDWMTSVRDPQGRANAETFLNWLLGPDQAGVPYGNAMRLGVMYIGWNDRIWRGYDIERGWTELKGCFATPSEGMDTTCHRNHIHISFTWDGASGRSSFWDATPMDGPYCDRQKSGATQVAGGRSANVVPVDPVHVLGTRKAVGVPVRCRLQQDRWSGDSHRIYVKVTGQGAVPATGVAAVAVQVTAMASNAPTNVRIWSPGQSKSQIVVKEPMNMDAVGTAIVPVASDGTIALATSAGALDVAVDVTGYYPAGDQGNDTQATPGASMPMGEEAPPAASPAPAPAPPPAQQQEQAAEFTAIGSELGYESADQGPLQPGEERVVGLNGVPDSATAALVLITTRQASKRGKLRIGVPAQKDATASFQFPKKGVRSAVMVVPVSGHQVKFVAPPKASLQLRVEVLGYTVRGAPIKIRGVPAVRVAGGKIAAGATKIVQISGIGSLPKKAKKISAVVLQVRTKGKDPANGTLKAYALDGAAPETRSATILAGKLYTTLLVAQVGTDGKVVLAPSVKAKVRATVVGFIHR